MHEVLYKVSSRLCSSSSSHTNVATFYLLPVGFKTCLCLFIQLLLVSLLLCNITVLLCTRLDRSYHAIVIIAYSRLRLAFSF